MKLVTELMFIGFTVWAIVFLGDWAGKMQKRVEKLEQQQKAAVVYPLQTAGRGR